MTVVEVYAGSPVPTSPSIMLLGPTPRTPDVPSWRPTAANLLLRRWTGPGELAVVVPEPRPGHPWLPWNEQVAWELTVFRTAAVLLFWVPRDMASLPGLTTNAEFGMAVATRADRMVVGLPPDCPGAHANRYLAWHARRVGVPVLETLADTVDAALTILTEENR